MRRNQGVLWGLVSAVLNELIVLVHALTGGVEWEVLFFGLLFSLGGMVVCAIAGAGVFAVLFFLLSLFIVPGPLEEGVVMSEGCASCFGRIPRESGEGVAPGRGGLSLSYTVPLC